MTRASLPLTLSALAARSEDGESALGGAEDSLRAVALIHLPPPPPSPRRDQEISREPERPRAREAESRPSASFAGRPRRDYVWLSNEQNNALKPLTSE